jgi:hypothetical protein
VLLTLAAADARRGAGQRATLDDATQKALAPLVKAVRDALSSKRLRKSPLPRSVRTHSPSCSRELISRCPLCPPTREFTLQVLALSVSMLEVSVAALPDPDELRTAAAVGVKLIFSIAKSAVTMAPDPKLLECLVDVRPFPAPPTPSPSISHQHQRPDTRPAPPSGVRARCEEGAPLASAQVRSSARAAGALR